MWVRLWGRWWIIVTKSRSYVRSKGVQWSRRYIQTFLANQKRNYFTVNVDYDDDGDQLDIDKIPTKRMQRLHSIDFWKRLSKKLSNEKRNVDATTMSCRMNPSSWRWCHGWDELDGQRCLRRGRWRCWWMRFGHRTRVNKGCGRAWPGQSKDTLKGRMVLKIASGIWSHSGSTVR